MPRSDQSQLAILGALSLMPMTGYALREEIKNTLGHFWSESFGQIYPALKQLERIGFVERQKNSHSRSSVFALTEAGLSHLRGLLAEPPQSAKPRNGLLLRLFFGSQLGPDACAQLILEAHRQAEETLEQMRIAREEILRDHALAGPAPYILLTISAGEHSARAALTWAAEALAELAKLSSVPYE